MKIAGIVLLSVGIVAFIVFLMIVVSIGTDWWSNSTFGVALKGGITSLFLIILGAILFSVGMNREKKQKD